MFILLKAVCVSLMVIHVEASHSDNCECFPPDYIDYKVEAGEGRFTNSTYYHGYSYCDDCEFSCNDEFHLKESPEWFDISASPETSADNLEKLKIGKLYIGKRNDSVRIALSANSDVLFGVSKLSFKVRNAKSIRLSYNGARGSGALREIPINKTGWTNINDSSFSVNNSLVITILPKEGKKRSRKIKVKKFNVTTCKFWADQFDNY